MHINLILFLLFQLSIPTFNDISVYDNSGTSVAPIVAVLIALEIILATPAPAESYIFFKIT